MFTLNGKLPYKLPNLQTQKGSKTQLYDYWLHSSEPPAR